jgi:hypothetical protein
MSCHHVLNSAESGLKFYVFILSLSDLSVLAEFSWNLGLSMVKGGGGGGCGECNGDRYRIDDDDAGAVFE